LPTDNIEEAWPMLRDPSDRRLVLNHLLDVLLAPLEIYEPYASAASQPQAQPNPLMAAYMAQQQQQQQARQPQQPQVQQVQHQQQQQQAQAPEPQPPKIPPGLSEEALEWLKHSTDLTSPILASRKLGILNFVTALFRDNEIIAHLLVGAGDVYTSVSNVGEELLKRTKTLDLENNEVCVCVCVCVRMCTRNMCMCTRKR
jgi:hypothetical protein